MSGVTVLGCRSPVIAGRYIGHLVRDIPRRPGGYGNAHGNNKFRVGECTDCGQDTWFNARHIESRRLVCWPCVNEAC